MTFLREKRNKEHLNTFKGIVDKKLQVSCGSEMTVPMVSLSFY